MFYYYKLINRFYFTTCIKHYFVTVSGVLVNKFKGIRTFSGVLRNFKGGGLDNF